MLEGEKNNLQANTRKNNFIVNQGVEKKFHDQTKSPPPPQKSNGRPLNKRNALASSCPHRNRLLLKNFMIT